METVRNSSIRFGNAALDRDLSASGDGPFDWSHHIKVNFDRPFLAPIPGKPKDVQQVISVVCTPRSPGVPVVAVVESVNTSGFTFRVRNADPRRGASGVSVDWLAVLNVPDANPTLAQQIDARFSILQRKSFDGFLNQQVWPRIWYSEPLQPQPGGTPPAILLTESDLHCAHGNPAAIAMTSALAQSDDLLKRGIINGVDDFGFSLFAFDVDTVGGDVAFCGASFVKSTNPTHLTGGTSLQEVWIDHGSETSTDTFFNDDVFGGTPYPISRGGVNGDWRTFDIYFDKPFRSPPIVLASARGKTPIVCIARRVTTHGFTLAARNTDSVDGHALFNWIAIGADRAFG